jgi:predicted TPR repeat methyltransferase
MGNSSNEGKQWIFDFFRSLSGSVKSVLDLGAGSGNYQKMMSPETPNASWSAVEIFKPYIDHYKLDRIYNKVIHADIRQFSSLESYDVVIAGDVLEHMTKNEAISVVMNLLPFCKYFIISIPIVKWEQGEIDGNPYEAHVKDDWSHEEVISTFPHIQQQWKGAKIGVYVLRGYVI